MGSATRVFLAHLRGVGVFDPNGDQVGKVRDAVVILRLEPNPPILTGLVVEVQHRRRIFVPMGRVTDIAGGQVLVTGTLNLRRFEKRENETLVAAELLDRQVTLLDTGDGSMTGGRLKRALQHIDHAETVLMTYGAGVADVDVTALDRKSTRLNSSHVKRSRMPSSA